MTQTHEEIDQCLVNLAILANGFHEGIASLQERVQALEGAGMNWRQEYVDMARYATTLQERLVRAQELAKEWEQAADDPLNDGEVLYHNVLVEHAEALSRALDAESA